jgi:4-hydroxybutyryl-CoA dehydratase/vinylacetyl-CoA-Delta-isomerase
MQAHATNPPCTAHLMRGADYRESLRRLRPVVYVDGRRVESVADEPALQPGINALAVTYDFALDPAKAPLMLARRARAACPSTACCTSTNRPATC